MNPFQPSPIANSASSFRRSRLFAAAVTVVLALSGTQAIAAQPHARANHGPLHAPAFSALDDAHLKHLSHELMERVDSGQGEQMRLIGRAALSDLELMEQEARAQRAPRAGILLADTIDRAALERLRVAEMSVADERSRRVDQLLIDLAAVMTAAQRARFMADIQSMAL